MPNEPEFGSWYIVVTCEHCNSILYLFRDLTEGKGSLSATYTVTCPRCQHMGEYDARHYCHASAEAPPCGTGSPEAQIRQTTSTNSPDSQDLRQPRP